MRVMSKAMVDSAANWFGKGGGSDFMMRGIVFTFLVASGSLSEQDFVEGSAILLDIPLTMTARKFR